MYRTLALAGSAREIHFARNLEGKPSIRKVNLALLQSIHEKGAKKLLLRYNHAAGR
ncbi:MAG: hypothetical protein HYZ21_01935 [Chloroflexi bacterium]|nr:hypothetical protein [Chloroflexota bacterium]